MHVAVPVTAPAARVQGLPVKAPELAGATVKVTVPVGVVGVVEVSVTVAVQDVAVPTTTEEGVQETVVMMALLTEGAVKIGPSAETGPVLNPAGEEFATVDPGLGTLAGVGTVRNHIKDMATARMRNADVTNVLLEVQLNGGPKLNRTVLGIVPPCRASDASRIKRISNPRPHSR